MYHPHNYAREVYIFISFMEEKVEALTASSFRFSEWKSWDGTVSFPVYFLLIGLQFNEMQTITNVWVGEWKEKKLQRERYYLYSPHRKQVWYGVSGVGGEP